MRNTVIQTLIFLEYCSVTVVLTLHQKTGNSVECFRGIFMLTLNNYKRLFYRNSRIYKWYISSLIVFKTTLENVNSFTALIIYSAKKPAVKCSALTSNKQTQKSLFKLLNYKQTSKPSKLQQFFSK